MDESDFFQLLRYLEAFAVFYTVILLAILWITSRKLKRNQLERARHVRKAAEWWQDTDFGPKFTCPSCGRHLATTVTYTDNKPEPQFFCTHVGGVDYTLSVPAFVVQAYDDRDSFYLYFPGTYPS